MSVTAARKLALEVITRVTADGAWAPAVLDAALRARPLDDREASFATRLAYGTVEMLAPIDEVILGMADRPGRIRPRVMNALRLATYELLWLGTPAAVAVDQGVLMVRARDQHAAGFANALLRRIAERAEEFPWGDPQTDLHALARLSGFPALTAEYLAQELSREAAFAFMRSCMQPAPLYLAANPFLGTDSALVSELAEAGAERAAVEPAGCVRCAVPRAALASEAVASGRALVCDAAAQMVASLPAGLGAVDVVDVGAGRGTKTALIAGAFARAGRDARILAVDVHEFKVEMHAKRMAALQVPGVRSALVDATDADALRLAAPEGADTVLLDAPCSGTGTLRRHPEKRWRLSPGDIDGLVQLQQRLLTACANLVRPGGFVVYSTCSVLPAENGGVVRSFLGGHDGSGFEIVDVDGYLSPAFRRFVTSDGWFQSMPEPDGPDGHFAVVLRRR